ARMWGDELPGDIDARVELMRRQFGADSDTNIFDRPATYLALSGGGANGAFGAGLLKGWSESGTRPEMVIVAGISTGALIAPYAFLGSSYDDELERFFTGMTTNDLVAKRSLVRGLFSDALYDTRRLRDLLRWEIDEHMILEIAREYRRGRRLLIGTTNLDSKRPVIWNIGAIAQIGTQEANQLIRDVILASVSIPGVFPPVRIKVKVGNQVYDEIHVDGGVSTQVFIYPSQIDLQRAARDVGITGEQTIYVIRNGYLNAHWSEVKLGLGSILISSLDTIIRTQGLGDLYRIYLGAVRDKAKFKLAYISDDFDAESNELFDPEYMKALFDFGYEQARNGYDWASSPPGFVYTE
ncbi:MAG: patatin-like phospholipase family protein, partial [Gammaproteobacteria bacterium]|nr:patatin-like phospholipase family protein [Gammaproteobacteria bacterium]